MKLYEFQAKKIIAEKGLKVPRGMVVENKKELNDAIEFIGLPLIVKAQILTGGRGKAGGVIKASTKEEAYEAGSSLFGAKVKGLSVKKVLIEEYVQIEKEFYAGVATDRRKGCPVVMLSTMGGIDIEEIAATQPNKIIRRYVDVAYGFHPFMARAMAFAAGGESNLIPGLRHILLTLYDLYWEKDGEVVEINPLALTKHSELICVDAKMSVDSNAVFRHPDIKSMKEETLESKLAEGGPRERLIYVPLEGNIGIMGTGAGMTMATMDQVIAAGGRPACFIDCGSSMRYVGPEKGIKLLKERGVDVILISTYTGGRSQMAAKRIVEVLESMPDFDIPVVVRIQGKNEEEAFQFLLSCKHPALKVAKQPGEAVRIAVELASERGQHEHNR